MATCAISPTDLTRLDLWLSQLNPGELLELMARLEALVARERSEAAEAGGGMLVRGSRDGDAVQGSALDDRLMGRGGDDTIEAATATTS